MSVSSDDALPGLIDKLREMSREHFFAAGEQLRRRGEYYRDMYLLTEGEAVVDFGGGTRESVKVKAGDSVGEMSFLSGRPATAEVVTLTPVRALVVDDETLARCEAEQPDLAVALLRTLGRVVDERTAKDLVYESDLLTFEKGPPIEVVPCTDAETLAKAQGLRYDVYCKELGRSPPGADHDVRVLSDPLDETGTVFLARKNGEATGTLRMNYAKAGNLGLLTKLYGMERSPNHPAASAICTAFVVRSEHRRGPTAMQLLVAAVGQARQDGIKEFYVDSIPPLTHYYRAMGFRPAGAKFLHRENGPSLPLVLDLETFGPRLIAEAAAGRFMPLYLRSRLYKFGGSLGDLLPNGSKRMQAPA